MITRAEQNALLDIAMHAYQKLLAGVPAPKPPVCDHCGGFDPTAEQKLIHTRRERVKAALDKAKKLRWVEDEHKNRLPQHEPLKWKTHERD